MNTEREALAVALEAVLSVYVGHYGLDDLTPPSDALDAALTLHEPYTKARERFRNLHQELRAVVADDVFFNIEVAVHEMVIAATDVGFRVGVKTCSGR